jgi:UDP-N-acetylmuramyl tripeptide synthase
MLRTIIAIAAAKIIINISRRFGNQGTVLAGRVARWLDPGILKKLAARVTGEVIIITGTNGKTTTSNMIAQILGANGNSVVHNQAGANMLNGITTAFIAASSLKASRHWDYALLETDEANVAPLLNEVNAGQLLITNFFRDQLDRYGELDRTIRLISEGVRGRDIRLWLNADDPLMSALPRDTGLPCSYYGFAATAYDHEAQQDSREGRYCMLCGEEIEYRRFHFAQLGAYRCPHCGNSNPAPDYLGSDLQLGHEIVMKVNDIEVNSPYQGFYNAYNILAAVAITKGMGIADAVIKEAIARFQPQAGRMERFTVGIKEATLILVKNPTGFDQSLQALLNDRRPKNLFLALNDNAADGRDISWIWDAELEPLSSAEAELCMLVCSGLRSGDMAVRLKYAGVATDLIQIESDLDSGIQKALGGPGKVSYILSTYTALFKCRKILLRLQGDPAPSAIPGERIYGKS